MATGKLTTLKVRSLVQPGRYGDGGGLWLQVRDAERRSWLFRYQMKGKARQMGLGPLEDTSLADARAAAAECRRQVRAGIDPIQHRTDARAASGRAQQALTFRDVAERYLSAHEASWRHPKHRAQWKASLEAHAFPHMGFLPVDQVTTAQVMLALEPIWHSKPETASRVRGRIESVLDYASAREWRSGENPARWRGHIGNMLPKRDKKRSVKHHPALPWREIGAFMVKLNAEAGVAALALEFTILTAARTNEVIGALWSEIDLESDAWTIPGARMKAAREHRVPLSRAALAVLKKAAEFRTDKAASAHVFPGSKPGAPLSNMAMAMLLRRMKRADLTVHGFRSTFRDWAAEATGVAREVAEAALAHSIGSAVEAAYRRGDLFEKRRRLMEDWALFCLLGNPPDATAMRRDLG